MPKIAIFLTGLVAGAINALAFRTADTLDDRNILVRGFRFLCRANQDASWNCTSFMAIVAIILLLLSLAGVVYTIRREKDWRVGLVYYLAGLLAAFGVLFLALT